MHVCALLCLPVATVTAVDSSVDHIQSALEETSAEIEGEYLYVYAVCLLW